MSAEVAFQRLYDRIELITGVGDARLGKLCIMSFVSLLAGENFGDRPKSASQVIRKFAIPVNDRMGSPERQRLKPFAPRIVGTNDGRDRERAVLLYRAIVEEVLPVLPLTGVNLNDQAAVEAAIGYRAGQNLKYIRHAWEEARYDVLAKECGHLIAALSERAGDSRRQAWFWDKAIDLLDRLCDIGAEERRRASNRCASTRSA
ncbi:hypothetical protein [Ferruginivarius sediminum]|uniref:Uncharacterized protein n=1 Tax=Ferruginivarius sediminum TaxID=2661937 RepID=A0A369TIE9_9PROT|nr:hypothetical protein [Ferruginivarius sediminum]RDD63907.1 hypothetical protein DRB17_01745 [Ferruginivarius sediminum]